MCLELRLQAFMAAWEAACNSTGSVRLMIPRHKYLIAQVKFVGPCKNVRSLNVYLKASFSIQNTYEMKIHQSVHFISCIYYIHRY